MDYEVNKLNFDEFGRPNGIIAINKPVGLTSHDVVAKVRKILSTPKVGHAGALDPFADGILIILVGKATKESDTYLLKDKSYLATLLLGVKTTSADPEGEILETNSSVSIPANLDEVLQTFTPEYEQYVPVFSSVKYKGEKLRVLARSSDEWKVIEEKGSKRFEYVRRGKTHIIDIPKHVSKIYSIKSTEQGTVNIADSSFYQENQAQLDNKSEFPIVKVEVTCSKGTYIRSLAEDIAAKFTPPAPAMLWNLTRTRIGDIDLSVALEIEEVEKLKLPTL